MSLAGLLLISFIHVKKIPTFPSGNTVLALEFDQFSYIRN
jgi:hypothetical protein